MSAKTTYIYRIEMGHYPNVDEIAFCYARNKEIVEENFKDISKKKNFNLFRVYKIGIADNRKHPGPFELLPKDEEAYIRKIRSTVGELYAERRNDVPGVFESIDVSKQYRSIIQREEQESISVEGKRVPDTDE